MLCAGFVALTMQSGSSTGAAAAPVEPGTQFDERWPLDREGGPIELSGLAPSTRFEVEIPPGWAASADGVLVLDYTLPELVESSAVGVTLNGEFVDAVALRTPSGAVEIALPAEGFETGANSIGVDATINVVDDRQCPDPWHPARVVTFAPSSRVEIPLVPVGPLLLDELPAALEPPGIDDRTVTIRLASSPSDEDLTAAAAVVAALRDTTEIDIDIEIASLTSGSRAEGPDVLIGVAADLEAAGYVIPSAPGGILEIGRNRSSNARLIVSGSTPADVLAAARVIGVAPATPVLVGIEPAPPPDPPPPTALFTLDDIGYPDRELVGPGVRSTVYPFYAPLSVAPTSMTITVDAVRSASGDEVSGLSVFVNGSRVGTVHFDIDTGATSGVQLNVSGDDVRPGLNFLRIDAEFQGPSHDCDQRPPDESVEVSASTAIELITSEDSVAVDLEDLPYLLRASNDSADLVVVLPENPTDQDLTDAIDIAVLYGHQGYPARVAHAGVIDADALEGRHVIALGEPSEQPLHTMIPDSIVATQDDPVRSEQSAVGSATRLDGVIEVVPNPADATKLIMLATGFDAAGADLAQRVLLDRQLRGELYGRATFVGGSPENPVLAPVLEPVRIQREAVAGEGGEPAGERPTTSIPESTENAPTIDEGTLFGDEASGDRGRLGSIPLGLVGIIGLGALTGGGILTVHRRRKDSTASSDH